MKDALMRGIALTVGVIAVLLITLEMQGNLGGSWTTVAQNVSIFAVALVVFGFSAAFLKGWI